MNLRAGGDRKSIFTDADPDHSSVCYWVIEPNGLAIPGSVSGNFQTGPLSNFHHAMSSLRTAIFRIFCTTAVQSRLYFGNGAAFRLLCCEYAAVAKQTIMTAAGTRAFFRARQRPMPHRITSAIPRVCHGPTQLDAPFQRFMREITWLNRNLESWPDPDW
jgi:hypothetical protein